MGQTFNQGSFICLFQFGNWIQNLCGKSSAATVNNSVANTAGNNIKNKKILRCRTQFIPDITSYWRMRQIWPFCICALSDS